MSAIYVNSQCQQRMSGIDVNRKNPHLVFHPISFPQLPQKLFLLGVVKKTDKMSMRKNHLRVWFGFILGAWDIVKVERILKKIDNDKRCENKSDTNLALAALKVASDSIVSVKPQDWASSNSWALGSQVAVFVFISVFVSVLVFTFVFVFKE